MSEKSYIFGNFSHVGRVRTENQDYFGYFSTVFGELFVVCDGVGGANGGSVASRTAVEAIRRYFDETELTDAVSVLGKSLQYAHNEIKRLIDEKPELYGMGTTCVAFLLQQGVEPKAWVAHAGDSRLYRIRRNHVEQITKDHSRVQEMVDHGILTPEQAENHQDSNLITRSLGGSSNSVQPDVSPVDICKNDRYIIATDGVTKPVNKDSILALSKKNDAPQDFAEALVALANDLDGDDNSTVQIIDIKLGPKPPRAVPVAAGEPKGRKLPIPLIATIGTFIVALVVVGVFFNPFKAKEIDPFENLMPLQPGRSVTLSSDTAQVVFQFDDSLITHLTVNSISGGDVKIELFDSAREPAGREYFPPADSSRAFSIALDSGYILMELVNADSVSTITFEAVFEELNTNAVESEPMPIQLDEWVTVAPQADRTEVVFNLTVDPSQRLRLETRGAPFTLSVGGAEYHLEPGDSQELGAFSEPEMILACTPDAPENVVDVPEFKVVVDPVSTYQVATSVTPTPVLPPDTTTAPTPPLPPDTTLTPVPSLPPDTTTTPTPPLPPDTTLAPTPTLPPDTTTTPTPPLPPDTTLALTPTLPPDTTTTPVSE